MKNSGFRVQRNNSDRNRSLVFLFSFKRIGLKARGQGLRVSQVQGFCPVPWALRLKPCMYVSIKLWTAGEIKETGSKMEKPFVSLSMKKSVKVLLCQGKS